MLCFAKLISGELVMGILQDGKIHDIIGVSIQKTPDNCSIFTYSYMPSPILPTLSEDKIITTCPISEEYSELIEYYQSRVKISCQTDDKQFYKH